MQLEFHDGDDMQDFFFGLDGENNALIYETIVKSIKGGIVRNKDTVQVWEIFFTNGDDDLLIDCERKDFDENLNNALNWYIEQEESEKCQEVKKLIEKLC